MHGIYLGYVVRSFFTFHSGDLNADRFVFSSVSVTSVNYAYGEGIHKLPVNKQNVPSWY